MQQKSVIDMSRPLALYLGGVAVVLLISLLVSNVPELAISRILDFPHRKEISAGLFMTGALAGAWTVRTHTLRIQASWRVSQAQVFFPFIVAFSCTLAALVLSH